MKNLISLKIKNSLLEHLQLFYPSISDKLLNLIIEEAISDFTQYTNSNEVDEAEYLLLAMAKERVNQIGAEGFASESVGGSSVSFNSDYSERIKKQLNTYKHIRTPQ